MCIIAGHSLAKVRSFPCGNLISIQVRVCAHCIVPARLLLCYIDDQFSVRAPRVVFITTKGPLWTVERLAFHNVFSASFSSIGNLVQEQMAVSAIFPSIPMAVVKAPIDL